MKEERVIEFLKRLGERIKKVVEEYDLEDDLDYVWVRYSSKELGIMDVVDGFDDPSKWMDADCSLAEFTDDPYLDVYVICEGWYGKIYRHVGYGTAGLGKALYEAFETSAEDFDMTMDFCDGALSFQSAESWKKQNEDDEIERERMEEESRRQREEI